jgi:hypothetical protein
MPMTMVMLLGVARGVVAGATTGAVFAAVGLLLMAWGWSYVARDRAIGRWPKAPGTITSSTYRCAEGSSRDAQGYDVTTTSFTPVVTYEYTVDGASFVGTQLTRAVIATSDADAVKRCIDRYPPRARVQVLYDPANPGTAYLEARTSGGAVFLMVFGGFFTLMGCGAFALIALTGS